MIDEPSTKEILEKLDFYLNDYFSVEEIYLIAAVNQDQPRTLDCLKKRGFNVIDIINNDDYEDNIISEVTLLGKKVYRDEDK